MSIPDYQAIMLPLLELAGEAIGGSGDEGIDGIIKEDRLGLDIIYLQAKRWEKVIGRPEIQRFAGALQGQRARKGVFITTSSFSRDAIEFATGIDTKIILIGGVELSNLMFDYGLGVSTIATYDLKGLIGAILLKNEDAQSQSVIET